MMLDVKLVLLCDRQEILFLLLKSITNIKYYKLLITLNEQNSKKLIKKPQAVFQVLRSTRGLKDIIDQYRSKLKALIFIYTNAHIFILKLVLPLSFKRFFISQKHNFLGIRIAYLYFQTESFFFNYTVYLLIFKKHHDSVNSFLFM